MIAGRPILDAVVVGGGPAGLTAAIALAGAGVPTALIAGRPRPADNRTTALLMGSVTALKALGVWQRCQANAAPLRVMRIIDDTGRLLRAPEVRFEADEIGLEAFGYNIENRYARERRYRRGKAGGRRRRSPLGLPCRGGYCDRKLELPAGRAHSHAAPQPAP
jgi:flavin-dependent dehydrogenase